MSRPRDSVAELVAFRSEAERLLTAREACSILACSRATLYRLPLPRVRVGRRGARWALHEVRAYIELNSSNWRAA